MLTSVGGLPARIADPRQGMPKTYCIQVEGVPAPDALATLRAGVDLGACVTRPAGARAIDAPAGLCPRAPPIRFRKHVPVSWPEIVLREGRNRQVRRMTVAVGSPTLPLIRWAVRPWTLEGLPPGPWRFASPADAYPTRSGSV